MPVFSVPWHAPTWFITWPSLQIIHCFPHSLIWTILLYLACGKSPCLYIYHVLCQAAHQPDPDIVPFFYPSPDIILFFLFSLSLPLQNSFHDNLIKTNPSFYTTFNFCAWSLPVGSHKLAVADMLHAHCLTVVKWKTHLTSDLSVLFFGLGTVSLHNWELLYMH